MSSAPATTQSPASCKPSSIRPFVPRKRGTKRQRLGCETCRFRRKKCDNTYPICGHCTRLRLACKFEDPRVLFPDLDLGNSNQSLVPASKRSLPPRASAAYYVAKVPDIKTLSLSCSLEKGEDKRHMLSYYTSVLAVILTTTNSNNSFLSGFLPMAMDSRALQNSLMAWSSAHISSYSKSHTVMALEHRSQALLASSEALAHCRRSRADLEVMLAVCLVLCSMEIVLGDTEHWLQHLIGAKEIILSAPSDGLPGGLLSGRQSNDSKWLLRNFAYHDIIGSLTTLQPPLLPGNYWIEEDTTIIDSYMGIGTEILAILSKVCSLDTCQNSIDKSGRAAFWPDSEILEADLQRWSCSDFSDLYLVKLVQAQRSTSLIVLYRKQRIYCGNNELEAWRLPAINSKIAAEVQESIYHMQQIDLDSLPAAGLLWPLFIAGGDAIEAHHCEAVRSLLQGMFNRRGFGNTRRAMEVLDELWRLRLNGFKGTGGRPLDWTDVLKKKGWKLMLS